jgi:hypothetical protein
MTKPTAFEEAKERYMQIPNDKRCSMSWEDLDYEWWFNAGRQAERDAQNVPSEDTKREQEKI